MRIVGTVCALLCLGASTTPPLNFAGRILTVEGEIDPTSLGKTMMHEHLRSDISIPLDAPDRWIAAGRQRPNSAAERRFWTAPVTIGILGRLLAEEHGNRDNMQLDSNATAIRELRDYRAHGGDTIVDVTSIGIGRNPVALREIARATGVRIVMGTGWYRAAWYPPSLDQRSVDSLANEMIRDITVGVGDSGVQAGIIGEIGAVNDRRGPLSPTVVRLLQASAQAARATGAAISLHTIIHPGDPLEPLDVLATAGADMSRVIVGHANAFVLDDAYIDRVIARGVMVQFDMLGWPGAARPDELNDRRVARVVVRLVKAGHRDRLLLSQDVCRKTQLKAFGGNGYSYILERFVPELRRQGLSEGDIRVLLVDNPRRTLTFVAPTEI